MSDTTTSSQTTNKPFSFSIEKRRGRARAGVLQTPHGAVRTPIFMPVGTLGSVKSLDQTDIATAQAEIILANTYHLYLRPGMEALVELGGLHQFMGWHKPILTDSGGFQVFSLGAQAGGKLAQVDEEQVTFRSHIDGSTHHFSAEKSLEVQRQIGADIIMAFDEAMPDSFSYDEAVRSLDRTHRWAERSVQAWERSGRMSEYGSYQALFGIAQGSLYQDLRKQSVSFVQSLPVDGIALGGETIGYDREGTGQILDWVQDSLEHEERPIYAMGLGRDPEDLLTAILRGVDMFDCVGPTRLARNGSLYAGSLNCTGALPRFESEFDQGRVRIGSGRFARDTSVIDPDCDCHTCSFGYTRAYLHHLFRTKELAYYRLASIHNVRFMLRLSSLIREWILGTKQEK